MKLNIIKKLAAKILGVGFNKVWIDPLQNDNVREAITKDDIRQLIKDRVIRKSKIKEHSRGRARILGEKKKAGRKSGQGKRGGRKTARINPRKRWIANVRAQRKKLKELQKKGLIKSTTYSHSYRMIKGNFFRGKAHLEMFAAETKTGK